MMGLHAPLRADAMPPIGAAGRGHSMPPALADAYPLPMPSLPAGEALRGAASMRPARRRGCGGIPFAPENGKGLARWCDRAARRVRTCRCCGVARPADRPTVHGSLLGVAYAGHARPGIPL